MRSSFLIIMIVKLIKYKDYTSIYYTLKTTNTVKGIISKNTLLFS
ncbi:Hypothetical protein FNO222_1139 [Francisella orientalis]|uniref:Uncharacterized protein n=1 Tax=Francisella orientalis TaxID=299583 RepID=A0ABN4H8D7_9GAMM|nr:hypothetical protein FNO12_1128 [Francisella orientalis FNO12]AKN87286.1 Hypothetical protein FNO24_1130 [Francisella orientalis FNO24]AKN88824.1 Hypothetical protein FNO190_1128 [Francisella orientalis]AKU05582.1 Hypothetical protein FNO01_1128 [Francisella orientalis]QEN20496.1 Hypothetical protein FNO39_1139 [Francisella orientalis]